MQPQPEQHASIPCAACQFPMQTGSHACTECGLPADVTQRLHKRFGIDLSVADKAHLLKLLRLVAAGLLALVGTAAGLSVFAVMARIPTPTIILITAVAVFLGVATSLALLGWAASELGARIPLVLSAVLLLCIAAHILLGGHAMPLSFASIFFMLLPLLVSSLIGATRTHFRLDGAMKEHGLGTAAATGWIVIAAELALGLGAGFDSELFTASCALVAAVAVLLALMDVLHTLSDAKRAIATKR